MATMTGTTRHRGSRWVQATLTVRPLFRDDAYEVEFGPMADGSTHRHEFSVTGWQEGHAAVRCPAELLAEQPELLVRKQEERTTYRRALEDYLGEYELVLSDLSNRRHPRQVRLTIYAPVAGPPSDGGLQQYVMFAIDADADVFAEFGKTLLAEIETAYPEPGDDGIDGEQDDGGPVERPAWHGVRDAVMDDDLPRADALAMHLLASAEHRADKWLVATAVGILALELGEYQSAVAWGRRLCTQDPNDAFAHAFLGDALYLAGLPAESALEYDRACRLESETRDSNAEHYATGHGRALLAMGMAAECGALCPDLRDARGGTVAGREQETVTRLLLLSDLEKSRGRTMEAGRLSRAAAQIVMRSGDGWVAAALAGLIHERLAGPQTRTSSGSSDEGTGNGGPAHTG